MKPATTSAVAILVVAAAVMVTAHDPITTRVTWDREIAPIVEARCVSCHSPGGRAPMSLATYTEARPWARAIREEVLARRMPKWPVVRGYGDFSNDPSLSAFEIALIRAWVDGGAPESAKVVRPVRRPARVLTPPAAAEPLIDRTIACTTQRLPPGRLFALRVSVPTAGSLRLTLEFANGTREPLLWVRNFDPRFSDTYELRSPLTIAPATRLVAATDPAPCAITLRGTWKER
jgi:hypothetical protein